jgi:hypothetical protein
MSQLGAQWCHDGRVTRQDPTRCAAVRRAIDSLYDVFASYRLVNAEPCVHCYGSKKAAAIGAPLRTKPLRDLALDEVHHFYDDGILTWGDVDDFRYLLPRLMQLLAVGWCPLAGDEDVDWDVYLTCPALGLFVWGEWWTWPVPECAAVQDFLTTLWQAYLTKEWEARDIVTRGSGLYLDLLLGILSVELDPTPLLAFWLEAAPGAMRDLSWFMATDQMASGYWSWPTHHGQAVKSNRAQVAAGSRLDVASGTRTSVRATSPTGSASAWNGLRPDPSWPASIRDDESVWVGQDSRPPFTKAELPAGPSTARTLRLWQEPCRRAAAPRISPPGDFRGSHVSWPGLVAQRDRGRHGRRLEGRHDRASALACHLGCQKLGMHPGKPVNGESGSWISWLTTLGPACSTLGHSSSTAGSC